MHDKMDNKEINEAISGAINSASTIVDLSSLRLTVVPDALLDLQHIEWLYMANNKLTSLPQNFFDALPSVQWLDLRHNQLQSLPSAYIGGHQCLRTILLEDNHLHTLPLELGLVRSLTGLNIAKNPLEFPPAEIISQGTQIVLAFLRDMLLAKTEGRNLPDVQQWNDEQTYAYRHNSSLSDGEERGDADSRRMRRRRSSTDQLPDGTGDLKINGQTSVASLRPLQSGKLAREKMTTDQLMVQKKLKQKSQNAKSLKSMDPTHLAALKKMDEVRKQNKVKTMKEQQEKALQKMRDQDAISAFRDDAKKMQRKKDQMRMTGALEVNDVAKDAPFGVDEENLAMLRREEIADAVRNTHEKMRLARPMSPDSLARLEEQRIARDQELDRRLRSHLQEMQDRRSQPARAPQDEMNAALKELRVAEELQKEIEARRKRLEYRFTAFL